MIKVLIAEDSRVQQELLRFLLEDEGDFDVVGVAADGVEAVEMTARLRPDIIVMDYLMPRMDGIEATRHIMEKYPTPIVMVSASSGVDPKSVRDTFDAIKIGALAVLSKPGGLADDHHAAELVETLRLMAEVKVVGRRIQQREQKSLPGSGAAGGRNRAKTGIVAIAGSTGAPGVVGEILHGIAGDLTVPVVVVQHMSSGFVEGFASWLAQQSGLQVTVARQGEQIMARNVYIAPDDMQMGIDSAGRVSLVKAEPEEGFRPSANYLFRSVASAYGPGAMGILLTGMGRDGATGLMAIREAGGMAIAQDEASCVVFGMPKEAVRLGAASLVLAPAEITKAIAAAK